jgi:hypothetical protein
MRGFMTLLLFAAVFCVLSAISGVQSFHFDSRTGTDVTYWHGYQRLFALVYAAACTLAFYGIYRRYPLVWKLGFVLWYLSAAQFIIQAWLLLWPQPYGWVGAIAVTVFTPLVALYWASWWRRQKDWFFTDGEGRDLTNR